MSDEDFPLKQKKGISKSDVFSSATLTGLATFILLTWSKSVEQDSVIAPYLTEQVVSFSAGIISFLFTLMLSFIRYEVNLKLHERDYTKKIKYLDQIISITPNPDTKKDLEEKKDKLLRAAANSIIDEKI